MVLAQVLYGGSRETKITILNMSSSELFPTKGVAAAMSEIQPLQIHPIVNDRNGNMDFYFPKMPIAQLEALDQVLSILRVRF